MNQRTTVLVVDDDVETVDTMREILSEEGHVVLCANDGHEALAIVYDRRPDLVLLDLNMPGMDGRAFLDAIRNDDALAEIVVVVVSGAEDARGHDTESVKKPLRLDTLLGLIDRVAHAAT